MTGLKYPECCVCKFLKELDVDEEKINDYHESKIGMEDFPPHIFKELEQFYDELDSNAHLILSTSHNKETCKTESKLSYKRLEALQQFLEDYQNDITGGGSFPAECGAIEKTVTDALDFIESLKALWWECAGCGRTVAPDEKYEVCNEEAYCMTCVEVGI